MCQSAAEHKVIILAVCFYEVPPCSELMRRMFWKLWVLLWACSFGVWSLWTTWRRTRTRTAAQTHSRMGIFICYLV